MSRCIALEICEPHFPVVDGIIFLEEGAGNVVIPDGMTDSGEHYVDYNVTGKSFRVVFDPRKVTVEGIDVSTLDYTHIPIPFEYVYLCPTGVGGYNLYYKKI